MKMFDYAMLTRLLEANINPKATKMLYVCDNKLEKKRFIRYNQDLKDAIVLTIDDVWVKNKIFNIDYKDYRII